MTIPIVQIYAFTSETDVQSALACGVDHIGFVAGDYGLVHGELTFQQARRMAEITQPTAKAVALTMSTDPAEILRMALAVLPDFVHISTEPDEVPLEAMQWLHMNLPENVKLMKAIAVTGQSCIQQAVHFSSACDCLLLDSSASGFPGVGATGQTHDWSISRRIVELVNIPVILAGGLSPENVQAAITAVKPWGVDSNTATNQPGDPVLKDMQRVCSFVEAARMGAA